MHFLSHKNKILIYLLYT